MSQNPTYPPAPIGVNEAVVKPSAAFKAQVFKVTLAIIVFIVSYVLLLVLALALAAASSYLGLTLIVAHPMLLTIMIGAGLIGLGLMVVYFLLKVIFKQNKVDLSGMIEITAEEEPALFDFIKKVSIETQTPFPKRIFISDDANASVFYDSSFLSLLFPVKKNLRIGLALVNVINVSEFKAIVAHEFGHFSQRSMKFGSYVYYVNNIIYNILYDNEDYDSVLNRWASMSQYFRLFAWLTVKIVNGIQFLQKQVYTIVNKAYSRLSIQMEYHADSVSAFVTGGDHLIASLKKVTISQICYANTLNYCNEYIAQNLRADNFYSLQNVVISQFADTFNIGIQNNQMLIGGDTNIAFNQSRIIIKDQWASHPSDEERAIKLRELNIITPVISDPAWVLFNDAQQMQTLVTHKAYDKVNFKTQPSVLDTQVFADTFYKSIAENNFNKAYKGYYDGRAIQSFPLEVSDSAQYTFDEIFSPANCALPGLIASLRKDIDTLEMISDKKNNVRWFDMDGTKYSYRDAPKIQAQFVNELALHESTLIDLDKKAFSYFYAQAEVQSKGDELTELYKQMFEREEATKQDMELYNGVMNAMNPIYGQKQFTEIRLTLQDVSLAEKKILPRLQAVLNSTDEFNIDENERKCITDYMAHNKIYFMKPNFDNQAIGIFNRAMNSFASIVLNKNFAVKKHTLDKQLNYSFNNMANLA